jgi:hypothetical protein
MPHKQKPHREDRGKHKPPIYFVPGQLLLTVEHDAMQADDLIGRLKETELYLGEKRLRDAEVDPQRVLTIDRAAQARFYEQASAEQTQSRLRRDKHYFPKGHGERPRFTSDSDLAPSTANYVSTVSIQLSTNDIKRLPSVVNRLNRAILTLQRAPQNELIFRGVSPNWFANGVQNNTGGSGPGGRAIPAVAPTSDDEFHFTLLNMPDLNGSQAEAPVDVIILDTAPPRATLDEAQHDNRNSVLLQRLCGPGGKLTIQYADDIAADLGLGPVPLPSSYFYPKYHDFPQADHGLFIAGIINTIAPNANLYLLEVLSKYGVGTDESIERGLLWALQHRERYPERIVIVNCSLMLTLPPPWLDASELASYWALFGRPNFGTLPEYKILSRPLEESCYHLRLPTSLVVAAAGNDGDIPEAVTANQTAGAAGITRKDARYPAAFDTVLGIGALKENSIDPTPYSNTSDEPAGVGIATFGGEKQFDAPVSASQVGTGMLGVYTGEFPDYEVNPTEHPGWAWWAGTSFAAPVITGTLAALAGIHGSLALATDELNAHVTDPPSGAFGGRFPAKQGQ